MHAIKITRLLATITLAASASLVEATTFNYSYTFGSGAVVSGSFSGTANGNLMTGISDITASLNGVSFGSPLYAVGYVNTAPNQYAWVPDAAIVSFDGLQNQFMFADNSMGPGHTNIVAYFYSLTSIVGDIAYPEAFATVTNDGVNVEIDGTFVASAYAPVRWSVSAVPLPASVWLLGSCLLGSTGLIRRNKFS